MKGLDTNVLVRYLTQDDPAQARKATALIEGTLGEGQRIHIDHIVLCELVWVLRSAYDYQRAEIAQALIELIEASQVSVLERDRLREAARQYRAGKGDFADYLIALSNQAAGCDTTLTLDRAHRKSALFTVL